MIFVREMTIDDASELEQIYLECRRRTFNWIDPNSFKLSDFKTDTEGEWVLVAERDGRIVGFSSVWIQDNFIHHLYVLPQEQGSGIGRALLEACFKGKLQIPARLKCATQNVHACGFYEALGWKKESTTADGPMGPYFTYLFNP